MIRTAILGIAAVVSVTPSGANHIGRRATRPVTYALPEDRTPAELSQADAEVVVNNCASCHSLDYIVTQPRGKGAKFWRDEVTKMLTVYKALVAPEDADEIARVLAAKFG